jgi:hypothetical protein
MPDRARTSRVIPERPGAGRLGRHVEHDERSRAFAVQPARDVTKLVSVRHRRRVGIYDQGAPVRYRGATYPDGLGSCVANAGAGVLSTAPFTHRFHEATAVRFYARVTAADEFPGAWPPDDTGSSGLAFAKLARTLGLIDRYDHAFSLEATLTAMQTRAVMLGLTWRTGADQPDPDGRIHPLTGDVRGGHEIVADELDVENRRVWLTQSWGLGYGLRGRCWVSWDDLGAWLADDGDATVLIA